MPLPPQVVPQPPADAPHLAGLREEVRAEAARARAEGVQPLPFSLRRGFADSGDRAGFEERYFARRVRLAALGAEAALDPSADPGALEDLLWAVCEETSWVLPAHERRADVDLFAAETADALAEIAVLLDGRLDARVAARVRAEVDRRVLSRLADDPEPLWWETAENNWAAVCGGASGIAALALLGGEPERLERVLERSMAAMGSFLAGYSADGGCAEGVGYWVYGFGYFVYFAEALRAAYGDGTDALRGRKVRAAAGFPAAVSLGDRAYVTFSDAPSARPAIPSGLVSRLAHRLGAPVPGGLAVPGLRDDRCGRWAHLWRSVCWTDPALLGRRDEPASVRLPELGWAVERGPWASFAARGGHNGEPHNHLDLGQFTVRAGGEELLADLGAGPYDGATFGPDRYAQLHPSGGWHSVPLVDGRTQGVGAEFAARVAEPAAGEGRFGLDLTAAYGVDGLAGLHRAFAWEGPDGAGARLTLTDTFRTTRPMPVTEVLVSRIAPEVDAAAGRAVWTGAAARAELRFDPAVFTPSAESAATLTHAGAPDRAHRLLLAARPEAGTAVHELTFAFTPR